jgi:hypothetical protein
VIYDLEGDLIHKHYQNKGVDERWCEPKNIDSMKIAEVHKKWIKNEPVAE